MINAYAPVDPTRRPAYLRIKGPYEVALPADREVWLSFFDHTKDNRFLTGKWVHHQLDYWTYAYQQTYYELHFIDQKELSKDLSDRFKASFVVTRVPEFGRLEVVPFMPMYDKLVYTPGIGYEGLDSFTVRPIVSRRGFQGPEFTFQLTIGSGVRRET